MTRAEITDTPPFEGMKVGLAKRVRVDPEGAVMIA
jgi:hypothetical protein